LIATLPTLGKILALAAALMYFLHKHVIFLILVVVTVFLMVVYIALALIAWRCPYCHQYLPLKDAGALTVCPHCQHVLREDASPFDDEE